MINQRCIRQTKKFSGKGLFAYEIEQNLMDFMNDVQKQLTKLTEENNRIIGVSYVTEPITYGGGLGSSCQTKYSRYAIVVYESI